MTKEVEDQGPMSIEDVEALYKQAEAEATEEDKAYTSVTIGEEFEEEPVDLPEVTEESVKKDEEVLDKEEEVDYTVSDTVEEPTAQEMSPQEELAYSQGWRPKKEFDGEGWVPAGEFLRRGELLTRITDQNKTIKKLNVTVDKMMETLKKQQEAMYESKIAQAKQLRKEAIEVGDVAEVEAYDEYIRTQEKELLSEYEKPAEVNTPTAEVAAPEIPIEARTFINKNATWWNDQSAKANAMRNYAIAREQEIRTQHPEATLTQVYDLVQQDVDKEFFNKQVVIPKSVKTHTTVEGRTNTSQAAKKPNHKSMSKVQKQIYYSLQPKDRKSYFDALVNTNELGKE